MLELEEANLALKAAEAKAVEERLKAQEAEARAGAERQAREAAEAKAAQAGSQGPGVAQCKGCEAQVAENERLRKYYEAQIQTNQQLAAKAREAHDVCEARLEHKKETVASLLKPLIVAEIERLEEKLSKLQDKAANYEQQGHADTASDIRLYAIPEVESRLNTLSREIGYEKAAEAENGHEADPFQDMRDHQAGKEAQEEAQRRGARRQRRRWADGD